MTLAALYLTEREFYGVPPGSTPGITFSDWLLRLVPPGLLAGA